MNPYKENGPRMPRARLSFDPAYCKRCIGRPSVNDGYICGPHRRTGRTAAPTPAATRRARPRDRAGRRCRLPRFAGAVGPARNPNAIAAIETLVRQRSNGAFIMRV